MTPRSGQARKKSLAIASLLTAPRIADAAAAVGVSESTIDRWLAEPEFRAAYRAAQRQALQQAIGALQAAAGVAVTVLRAAMLDQSASAASRLGAARAILEFSFRGAEMADLEERLEVVESQIAQQSLAS
jgi:hypothetical protein